MDSQEEELTSKAKRLQTENQLKHRKLPVIGLDGRASPSSKVLDKLKSTLELLCEASKGDATSVSKLLSQGAEVQATCGDVTETVVMMATANKEMANTHVKLSRKESKQPQVSPSASSLVSPAKSMTDKDMKIKATAKHFGGTTPQGWLLSS